MPKEIAIEYFALFFQERGVQRETFVTQAQTVGQLFCELKETFHFKLPQHLVKVALNQKVVDWDALLKSGDTVLLIPPIAGG